MQFLLLKLKILGVNKVIYKKITLSLISTGFLAKITGKMTFASLFVSLWRQAILLWFLLYLQGDEGWEFFNYYFMECIFCKTKNV